MNVLFPRSLRSLFDALAEPGARVLAGGTDLLVRLRARPEPAATLVSLDRLPALRGIREEDGPDLSDAPHDSPRRTLRRTLRIGAATTHAEALAHPLLRARLPMLASALASLGSPPIRTMGTLGGNLCTASPAGDTLPPLTALCAQLELASAAGTRRLGMEFFLTGPGRTALAPGEILTAIHVPLPEPGDIQHFEKVGRRNALAVAVVSLAALVRTRKNGEILEARLAWGSCGPTVMRCPEAEAALTGRKLSRSALAAAADHARACLQPISDTRASADYRRQVAGNLLLRLADL